MLHVCLTSSLPHLHSPEVRLYLSVTHSNSFCSSVCIALLLIRPHSGPLQPSALQPSLAHLLLCTVSQELVPGCNTAGFPGQPLLLRLDWWEAMAGDWVLGRREKQAFLPSSLQAVFPGAAESLPGLVCTRHLSLPLSSLRLRTASLVQCLPGSPSLGLY